MTDSLSPSRHVSYDQVKAIIDFMGQHVDFATGSLRSLEARQTSKTLWNDLTTLLNNSRSGTKKTSDGWSKYWSDFKNKLKNKVTVMKKKKIPGSTSSRHIKPLTRLEKRALVILGPHFERKISKVTTDPFSNISNCPPEVKLEGYSENGHNSFSNNLSENFLVGESLLTAPDYNYEPTQMSSLRRWQLTQRMLQTFWKRWSQEYLTNFFQRYKWNIKNSEIKIGDVVLVREDNLPPTKWLYGRVVDVHPGKDNITRVVTIRYKSSLIQRPTSRLCLIPVVPHHE